MMKTHGKGEFYGIVPSSAHFGMRGTLKRGAKPPEYLWVETRSFVGRNLLEKPPAQGRQGREDRETGIAAILDAVAGFLAHGKAGKALEDMRFLKETLAPKEAKRLIETLLEIAEGDGEAPCGGCAADMAGARLVAVSLLPDAFRKEKMELYMRLGDECRRMGEHAMAARAYRDAAGCAKPSDKETATILYVKMGEEYAKAGQAIVAFQELGKAGEIGMKALARLRGARPEFRDYA